ncbi:MAG: YHS domain-containing protein [Sphingomonas sp.]|nr:YHS domain-containing protein [Sphingomonas sp.]
MNRKFLTTLAATAGLAVAAAAMVTAPAMAVIPTSTSAVNTDEQGIALHGYDAVAYFTVGKPTQGDARFKASYNGATYLFATAENQHKFQANPAAFAPQYGGFCAMGVALEKKLDGDPNVWKIVGGKLYLNVNQDVSVAWNRDIPGNLARANENWPTIKNQTPESLN